jgi:hypothetical protein
MVTILVVSSWVALCGLGILSLSASWVGNREQHCLGMVMLLFVIIFMGFGIA